MQEINNYNAAVIIMEEVNNYDIGVIIMEQIILDGNKMISEEIAHDYISEKMNFPDYYGKNLDALWDMLSEWDDTEIKIINLNKLKMHLGPKAPGFIGVFKDAIDEFGLTIEMED